MKKRIYLLNFVMPLVAVILSACLLVGCGDRDSANTENENESALQNEEDMTTLQQPMNEGENMSQIEATTFEATLSGSNEVPEVQTDATGMVTVTLRGDSIHVKGEFSGLGSEYTASHIHKGAKGENGSPIQPLEPTLGADKTSGSWDATFSLDEQNIAALKADSLYINVHSAEHKPGEIRGQLSPTGSGM